MYSDNIAQKLRLASNRELAERYGRLVRRTNVEDRKGRSVEVVVRRRPRSNGLLDE